MNERPFTLLYNCLRHIFFIRLPPYDPQVGAASPSLNSPRTPDASSLKDNYSVSQKNPKVNYNSGLFDFNVQKYGFRQITMFF